VITMADISEKAAEVLDHGDQIHAVADMGSFTSQSLIFDGGLRHEDNDGGGANSRRVGTYDKPLRPGDPVKIDESADNEEIVVTRMDAGDHGAAFMGLFVKNMSVAGDTEHASQVYIPGDLDILVYEGGSEVDGTDITVGDSVSLSADAYDKDRPHGFAVRKDDTHGSGRALNKIAAQGEEVKVLVTPGR